MSLKWIADRMRMGSWSSPTSSNQYPKGSTSANSEDRHLPRSADFQICCIADFQIGTMHEFSGRWNWRSPGGFGNP